MIPPSGDPRRASGENPHGRRSSRKPLRRPRPGELRAIYSCSVSYFILESLEPGTVLSSVQKKKKKKIVEILVELNGMEFLPLSLSQFSLGTYHQSPRVF